ncbi:MAG: hypothetical protein LW627_09280 [Ilumatobacteraceae bacterium]|jgi:hypothetical protein|nr:hypothetical protein [Ilumatobacteraceae bacterium]
MTRAVEFSVSYRALSDSALISCADSEVAEALGVPVDEVDQQQLDHDTTVESLGVERGDALEHYFLAAQVLGVALRSRLGLVDHVLPTRLHSTLMSLVHESTPESADHFTARRVTTWVPLHELTRVWSARATTRRPSFEVKAVTAALDDLSRAFGRRGLRPLARQGHAEISESLCSLIHDLEEADGLPVPMAVARTTRALSNAPEPLRDITVPIGEAVIDLASSESWVDSARIMRDARQQLARHRPGDGPNV